jgi:hypothetical protein
MAKPYSIDLRERAVAAVLRDGLSRHESAARFGVAPSAVINWVRVFGRQAAWRQARWVGTSPKRSLASMRGSWRGASETGHSPCEDWSPNSANAALKSTIGRCGILPASAQRTQASQGVDTRKSPL